MLIILDLYLNIVHRIIDDVTEFPIESTCQILLSKRNKTISLGNPELPNKFRTANFLSHIRLLRKETKNTQVNQRICNMFQMYYACVFVYFGCYQFFICHRLKPNVYLQQYILLKLYLHFLLPLL